MYRSDRSRGYKYPFTCVRLRVAFVFRPWIVLSPKSPPLCSSPSIPLFRVEFVMDLWDFVSDLIGKGGPILLVPSGLLNQSNPLVFVPLCDGFRFHFWCTWLRGFYELFVVILVLLILSQTLWNHELFWIGVLEFLRKPQSFLISTRILELSRFVDL